MFEPKLTDAQRVEILVNHMLGTMGTMRATAARYSVTSTVISQVCHTRRRDIQRAALELARESYALLQGARFISLADFAARAKIYLPAEMAHWR